MVKILSFLQNMVKPFFFSPDLHKSVKLTCMFLSMSSLLGAFGIASPRGLRGYEPLARCPSVQPKGRSGGGPGGGYTD